MDADVKAPALQHQQPSRRQPRNESEQSRQSENSEDEVQERIATHRKDIEQHVNISELSLYLEQEGLLEFEENDYLLSKASDREKVSRVLDSLKEKPNGFTKFLKCVKRETYHMGHPYVASLLEGKPFASEHELLLSVVFKGRIEKNLVRLKEGINLSSLRAHLRQSFYLPYIQGNTQLLTDDDLEKLEGVETESKVMQLFLILDTKGPLAHSRFASCLHAEREHKSHIELYEELFGDLPGPASTEKEGSGGHPNRGKRKNTAEYPASDETRNELVPLTPSKRALLWLEMDGPFKGKGYLQLMRVCYRYHHSGQHDALEGEVQKIMSCNSYPPDFQALARVELALSCTFQGKKERALELIEGSGGALSICEKIPGNNAAFLIGRCMHLLSGLHRYAKQHDKAKEYATKAMVALDGVAPGQESSIANYVNACIFLESSDGTPSDVRIIEQHFRSAIDHAHQSEIATYVILPQSHVRLAQLYLGSTQYHHGTTTNSENIRKARDSLNAVNFGFMSERSKSLYYMAESDCYRAEGDIPAATDRAKLARSTAEDIQFTLGVNSAESRLKSLQPTLPVDSV